MQRAKFSTLGSPAGGYAALIVAFVVASVPASEARASDEPVPLPVARVMLGPAFHVGAPDVVQFTMDADAGVVVLTGKDRRFLFGAELGYTYDNIGVHAFNLAASIGVGSDFIAYVAYQPRMLLGSADGSFVGGMRNGITGRFLFDLFDVELGHQFLASEGQLSQSVNLTFGMNPAAVIYVFARVIGWGASR